MILITPAHCCDQPLQPTVMASTLISGWASRKAMAIWSSVSTSVSMMTGVRCSELSMAASSVSMASIAAIWASIAAIRASMASMSMAFFVWATVSWKRCSSVSVSWDLPVPLWKDKGPTENRSDHDWARLVQRSNLHPFHWTHLYPFWTFREYFSKRTYRVYYCVYSKFENSTSAIWLLFTWLWVRIFQTWGTTAGETVLSSTRTRCTGLLAPVLKHESQPQRVQEDWDGRYLAKVDIWAPSTGKSPWY